MQRRRFQSGGFADDEEFIDDEIETLSPTQQLVDTLSQPSAQETEILGRMRTQADEVRAALRRARERLQAQQFPKSQAWFAAAEGFGAPTKSGNFFESLGNVGGALAQYSGQRGEFERGRDKDLAGIDTELAGVDDSVLQAEFELEKIRQAQRARVLTGMAGSRTPAALSTFEAMTANLSPERKEQAREVYLGLRPRAGQFSMTDVAGQRGVRGVDDQGNPIFIPLSTQEEELGAQGAEAAAGTIGKAVGEQYSALQDAALQAPTRRSQLAQMNELLDGLSTGTLTPLVAKLSGIPETFGITIDENLGAKQAAEAIGARFALESQFLSGNRLLSGATSEGDRDLLVQRMSPSLAQSPEGRRLLVDTYTRLLKRTEDTARLAREYRRRNNGVIDEYFLDELAAWAEQNPLFPEEGGGGGPRGGGQQLTPEQQAELDSILQQPLPVARAKGGRIRRRYQEGGRVVTLSDGTRVAVLADGTRVVLGDEMEGPEAATTAQEPPEESVGARTLEELRSVAGMLGVGAAGVGGAGAGLMTEALGTRGANALLGGPSRSERTVLRALDRDMGDPAAALSELEGAQRMGVPTTLMEAEGPYTSVLGRRALMNASPEEAIAALNDMQERHRGSRQRVVDRSEEAFNPLGEDYFAAQDRIQNDLYTNAKPLYEAAYAKYPALKEDPAMTQILDTPAGKKAVQYAMTLIRNQPGKTIGRADVTGMVRKPSLEFYDYVKRGFDQLIAAEEKGGPTPLGHAYREMRRAYRDQLDTLAPDEYKAARQQYAGDLEVRDALESGRVFHRFQPEELTARAKSMSQAEMNAFRQGIGQRLSELIQAPSTDSNTARKLVESPAMLKRLEPFFETPQAFDLFREALKAEVDLFDQGKSAIARGESAARAKAEEEFSPGAKTLRLAGAGVRAFVSPLGVPSSFALRLIADRPKMTKAEASRVLEVLRRGDPNEMAQFARRAGVHKSLSRYRTGRRAGAAIAGAAAGTALALDDEEEE